MVDSQLIVCDRDSDTLKPCEMLLFPSLWVHHCMLYEPYSEIQRYSRNQFTCFLSKPKGSLKDYGTQTYFIPLIHL